MKVEIFTVLFSNKSIIDASITSMHYFYQKNNIGKLHCAYRDNRKDEKIISRLRTGSCLFLYHHYFDTNQQIETCTTCNIALPIKHIIVECPALNNSRRRITNYLNQKNRDLTEENILCDYFPQDLLLKFLKETQYYKKI